MGENESDITLLEVLHEIKKNRSEIKNAIEAIEARLLLEIADLKNKNCQLEEKNQKLQEEIERIKRNSNKNSIVVFGLQIPRDTFTIQDICSHIFTLIEVEIKPADINNYYTLGNTPDSPLKIDFVNYWVKSNILKNCFKLKDKKGISIAPALTQKQRTETKILRKHLFLAKQDKKENCYIKQGKLYVNNQVYTVDDLTEVEDNNERHTNSAPPTPTPEVITCAESVDPVPEITKKLKNKPEGKKNQNITPTSSKNTVKPFTRLRDQKSRNNSASSYTSRR